MSTTPYIFTLACRESIALAQTARCYSSLPHLRGLLSLLKPNSLTYSSRHPADAPGIVARVTTLLAKEFNIIESSQFGDLSTQTFFMRTVFVPTSSSQVSSYDQVKEVLSPLGKDLGGEWHVYDTSRKPKVLLLVSKIGHVLNDLLFRHSSGQLDVDIPLIVSNHDTFKTLAASYNVPFVHIPVTSATKEKAEAQLLDLIKQHEIELVVLARYMQIMSTHFCSVAPPTLNVHHAILPSFKGGRAVSVFR